MSECDRETSTVRRSRLTKEYCAMKENQDVGTTSPRKSVTISVPTRHYIPQDLNLQHMHLIIAAATNTTTTTTTTAATTTTTNTSSSSSSSSSNTYSLF